MCRRLLLLLTLTLACAVPVAAQTSYTTAFPSTENPISETSKWTNGLATGLDWRNVRTTAAKAFGTQVTGDANFTDSLAILSGVSGWAGEPQVVRGTVFVTNTVALADTTAVDEEVELLLRFTITANSATGYECLYSVDPNNVYVQIARWNGPLGNFTQLLNTTSTALVTGDIVTCRVSGSYISIYRNDTFVGGATDTTYTTGSPGIGFYYDNDAGVGTYVSSDYGFSAVEATNFGWAYSGVSLNALHAGDNGTTWNIGTITTPPNGARVILAIDTSHTSTTPRVSSIADTQGRTYTREAQFTTTGPNEELAVWSTIANGSAFTNVTITYTSALTAGSSGTGVSVVAYGGLSSLVGAAGIDASVFVTDSTTPYSSGATPNTTNTAHELALGFFGDSGNNLGTITAGTGYRTIIQNVASGVTETGIEEGNIATAGSAVTATWTASGSAKSSVGVIVYKFLPIVVLTGTITASTNEGNIVAGGKTIILTLSGDTYVPAASGTITYVGGQVGGFAGTTSAQTITFALTGGEDSVPAANDLVIITYSVGSTADRSLAIRNTGATDYTLMGSELYQNDTFDSNQRTAYRFMPSTPETQFLLTETVSGGTGNIADAGEYTVHVFRGVDLATPMDVAVVTTGGINASAVNAASITPTTSGAWIYVAGAAASGTGSTMTSSDLTAFSAGSTADTNDISLGAGYKVWTSGAFDPAAYGNIPGGTTANSWTAVTAALRPSATPFDDARQALLDGLLSAQSEATGWNIKVHAIALSSVVRTSSTVATITLPAIGTYDITATETVTATIPVPALTGSFSAGAAPTFTVVTGGGAACTPKMTLLGVSSCGEPVWPLDGSSPAPAPRPPVRRPDQR